MKSLFQKSLVTTGLVTASLALAGNAMAANVQAKTRAIAAQTAYVDVAAIPPYPNNSSTAAPASRSGPGINVGQLIATALGSLPPQYAGIVQNAMRESASHRASGSDESSGSYDFSQPSPTVDVDNSQSQAAIDASDQAMQQMDQDLQAMDASNAAAEAQNDAANAAAVQTDINAGM
jgi:hypothetical protein